MTRSEKPAVLSDCKATREQLLDAIRGRLSEPERQHFAEHLQGCTECSKLHERELLLDRALAKRPSFSLPDSLRGKLRTQVIPAKPKPRLGRWAAVLAPGLAAAALLLFVVGGRLGHGQQLVDEAVNDHLRVLYAERPIEIESGGIHQVKPWFAGRLDFAPVLSFSGDDEFPLEGGAIGLFVDRKAATFVFKHRLHTATLFVFRSEGLGWPLRNDTSVGALPASSTTSRGFNVLLWRAGDLGYALVSDVDRSELARLAAKVAAP
ncbi:MAG TPA: zf-HC2 domain-containing protein [Polyangiaceae bacterium]|jgi:anti-sigma factor RsiW|nr:zf-HC2 domain-containing protein [Polyangiaceae bacterium]